MSDLCMVCNANAMDSDDVKNLSLAVPLGNDHIISPQHEWFGIIISPHT